MRVADFDFELPADRIAQHAVARGASRLLVLDREGGERHRSIADLPDAAAPGRPAGGQRHAGDPGAALRGARAGRRADRAAAGREARAAHAGTRSPGRGARRGPARGSRLAPGARGDGRSTKLGDGRRRVEFSAEIEPRLDDARPRAAAALHRPPRRRRGPRALPDGLRARATGRSRRRPPASTSPRSCSPRSTARGVERVAVTLHVGIGTFKPVKVELVHEHRMERERYAIPEATADGDRADAARRRRRVVAVGTTVVRTLESGAADAGGGRAACAGGGLDRALHHARLPVPRRRRCCSPTSTCRARRC